MAVLAVGKLRGRAEHSVRRPVGKVRRQGNVLAHGHPREIAAQLHKPDILPPDEIERQKAHRAVGETCEERLGTPTLHVSPADGGLGANLHRRGILELDSEHIVALLVGGRDNDGVLEAERLAVEAGNDFRFSRLSASASVSGVLPQIKLLLMTAGAGIGAGEVLEARRGLRGCARRRGQRREIGGDERGGDSGENNTDKRSRDADGVRPSPGAERIAWTMAPKFSKPMELLTFLRPGRPHSNSAVRFLTSAATG